MSLQEYEIEECWKEGGATVIRLCSKPDVAAWVRWLGIRFHPSAAPAGPLLSPAVRSTCQKPCVQIPGSLAKSIPDKFEYFDVVRVGSLLPARML